MRVTDELAEALEPFKAYTQLGGFDRLPDGMEITQGSRIAARQLTAGDLRKLVAALEAALAVEGTEAKPVAWRTNIFESVNAGKLSRLILDADEVKDPGRDWQPLYTAPPAGIREALINLNAELDAMWNTPADQRVQDGKINSVLVQNITNAQIACARALRGQS